MTIASPRPQIFAVLVAAATVMVGQAALTEPASAGGRVSWTYAPSDRDASSALSMGLQAYGLINDLRSGEIRQKGRNNRAGLGQNGRGNLGIVQQRGDGHSGTLQQNGDNNAFGLFQFGRGTDDHVVQNGDGGSGTTFSYGW